MTPAFNALEPVYGWLYHGLDGTGIWLGVGRFLVSAALLALPTTLMGATLPLLSPEVVEATKLFSEVNQDALADPRTRMIVGDGRNHLALAEDRYDVIISQPSSLWIAGMADLFTREFFHDCRQKLAPGGLVGIWLQAYALAPEDVQTIVATFADAFPHVAMWELMPGIDYLLVSSAAPVEVGLNRLATRLERPGVRRDLARSGGGDALDLLCSYVMGDQ